MYVIWLDDARARAALRLAHDARNTAAAAAGARPHDLPDWEDPADVFAGAAGSGAERARDPAERAEQIRAFVAAAGGEQG